MTETIRSGGNRPTRPRPEKRFRVHAPGDFWLRALDPLQPGMASKVRSEWTQHEESATVFGSLTYAEAVAENAPPLWRVQRDDPTTTKGEENVAHRSEPDER